MKLLGKSVLIRPLPNDKKGLLWLPETRNAKKEYRQGIYLDGGPGYLIKGQYHRPSLNKGDTVIFQNLYGVEIMIDDEELFLMSYDQLLAVLSEIPQSEEFVSQAEGNELIK